jgi:glutathione S-transferase
MGVKRYRCFSLLLAVLAIFGGSEAFCRENPPISADTQNCLMCHQDISPNIYANWKKSRMSQTTPAKAQEKPELERRVSFESRPEGMAEVVVGCAECHTLRPGAHEGTFSHQGYQVHTVVTPDDCAVCHPVERSHFSENLMSQAHGNLQGNPVFSDLVRAANGPMALENMHISQARPAPETDADACLSCHGTKLSVTGKTSRETDFGPMEFPKIEGWPNQGVGRVNTDGSKGSCSACHSRHRFAIEMARKPYTCSECHKGPDVPAFKAYKVSKHANVVDSLSRGRDWDFSAVPWTAGRDFTAPTCAVCHISLVASPDGRVRAERTHRMNDRLAWRIFGLIYAHAHPKSADTTRIENKNGLPLPTALDGTPAQNHLISKEEQEVRTERLKGVCQTCHSTQWVDGHFQQFHHTIETTNHQTRVATRIMVRAWENGAVSRKESLFDEAMERRWVEQWLFFANSTRFASAMMGADYGVFENGRWMQTRNAHELLETLRVRLGNNTEVE